MWRSHGLRTQNQFRAPLLRGGLEQGAKVQQQMFAPAPSVEEGLPRVRPCQAEGDEADSYPQERAPAHPAVLVDLWLTMEEMVDGERLPSESLEKAPRLDREFIEENTTQKWTLSCWSGWRRGGGGSMDR